MSDLRKEIMEGLKKRRDSLSASSLKTYTSLLVSLYNKLDGDGGINFFDNFEKIIEHIRTLEKDQSKKTILSALFVLTNKKQYQDEMHQFIKVVNDFYKTQKTNPERQKKLKSFEEIVAIHEQIKAKYKKNPTLDNRLDLLLSYLSTGVLEGLAPRRLLDYSVMKIRNYNKESDNYILGNKFYFNQYKTKDRYGQQVIPIPTELKNFITKWKSVNESDYLLVNQNGEQFTTSALSKKIKNLFDDNSIDMLRSIFLSNVYKDLPELTKMESLATQMGHSIMSQLNYYVKKD